MLDAIHLILRIIRINIHENTVSIFLAAMKETSDPAGEHRAQTDPEPSKRQINSDTLMQGKNQIDILHWDQIYHLRVTRQEN
jgi:hemin uptake protein HemP